MVNFTASMFKTLINDSTIPDATAEQIIDLSIDCANLEGNLDLPNMSGTAGSKTVSLESREKGVVCIIARAIYYSFYKGIETVGVGGLSVSTTDLLGNSAVLGAIKEAARQLSEVDVSYG